MAEHLYIVGGSKGGVGKSIVSMTLIDHLRKLDKKVVLIESDTSNPDVWKAYNGLVKSELVNLDKKEGWMELVDICDENGDCVVVVNTAARNNEGVAEYAETLTETLRELQRKIATLWVINTQKDSLELLVDYLRAVPDGDRAEQLRTGADRDVVLHRRMALARRKARATERDALVHRHVVADIGRLADHDPRAVIDEEALAYVRPGVDLDSGDRACEHRDRARDDRHPCIIEGVRNPVGEQRVDARPGGEDLNRTDAPRRRVAIAGGEHISTQLPRNPGEGT